MYRIISSLMILVAFSFLMGCSDDGSSKKKFYTFEYRIDYEQKQSTLVVGGSFQCYPRKFYNCKSNKACAMPYETPNLNLKFIFHVKDDGSLDITSNRGKVKSCPSKVGINTEGYRYIRGKFTIVYE